MSEPREICEHGHGRLTATNWIEHGVCTICALLEARAIARRWYYFCHPEGHVDSGLTKYHSDHDGPIVDSWKEKGRRHE